MEEHKGRIAVAAILILLVVTGVVYFLARGIQDGQPIAWSIAIVLWTSVSFSAGAAFVLVIQAIGEGRETRRARLEEEHFRQNTQENLALMGAMVKVQNAQAHVQSTHTAMLQRQAREQIQLLAAGDGNGTVDIDAQIGEYSDIFEGLDD
jgi:hypothetical protein